MSDRTNRLPADLEPDAERFFIDSQFYNDSHHEGGFGDRLQRLGPAVQLNGVCFVAGHEAVGQMLRDSALWNSSRGALHAAELTYEAGRARDLYLARMAQNDGERHAQLRRIVLPGINAKTAERWRAEVSRIADSLLDEIAEAGQVDLMAQLARRLPEIFACVLFDLPESDLPLLQAWSIALVRRQIVSDSSDLRRDMTGQLLEFADYLSRIVEARRANPGDDLLSALIRAHADERLDVTELVALMQELVMGGVDTTANVIGSAVWLLLDHPEQLDRLRAEPALMRRAIEEVLRCEPATLMPQLRVAARPAVLAGQPVPEGALGVALLGTANRDPAKFARPHVFDITRSPNPHLAFGGGNHFCIGSPFARMEMEVVLPKLLARFPRIEWVARPRWKDSLRLHGPESLDVRCWPR